MRRLSEPGLRLIKAGGPKPWEDMHGFLKGTAALAREDLEQARAHHDMVIFDRGLIDALSGLAQLGSASARQELRRVIPRFRAVFFAPPWREIFAQNDYRRHNFESAAEESDRLLADLRAHGCEPIELPKFRLDLRCEYMVARLQSL